MLGDQNCYAGALRFIILARNVQNVSANDINNVCKNFCQTFCTVQLIDVLNVLLTLFICLGVTDVVNIKTQRLGQIVETVQAQLIIQ